MKGSTPSAGVDTVLEGAMRRSGGRLRLSVHLVNAANGFDLYADDHFESEVRELLDAQSQLTEAFQAVVPSGARTSILQKIYPSPSLQSFKNVPPLHA